MEQPQHNIYEIQAELCKVFASPIRIEILNLLQDKEKTVTELVALLGVPKANVSQHLAIMKHKGILKSRREGVNIYYSIVNPKTVHACTLMKEVLNDILLERSRLSEDIQKKGSS